jgi:cathepsin C
MSVKRLSSPKVVAAREEAALHVPRDVAQVNHELRQKRVNDPERRAAVYHTDHEFLAKVNKAAEGWFTVKRYPEYEGQTIGGLERRRGSTNLVSPLEQHAPTAHHRHTPQLHASAIPQSWDWRNISGENFVSPVRDQGQCGSCYSFGSSAMLEARIRIRSKNAKQPILSPQDVLSCSNYAQGCSGGFPYLIAGKYGRDYGLLEEACYPYQGIDSACTPNPQPGCNRQRWMTSQYYYIGGFEPAI